MSTASATATQQPEDRLRLHGLRAHAFHGVLEHERRDGQEFVVDVVLGIDTRAAAENDDLSATVHYGELAQRLHTERPVTWVQVTVHKPEAPIPVAFDDVSLTIHRSRDD